MANSCGVERSEADRPSYPFFETRWETTVPIERWRHSYNQIARTAH